MPQPSSLSSSNNNINLNNLNHQNHHHCPKRLSKPLFISSPIVHGFGRGSKKLGIPTANFQDTIVPMVKLDSGVYYGFAQLIHPINSNLPKQIIVPGDNSNNKSIIVTKNNPENPIYPTVFSLGWNPHFNDVTKRSLEAHILYQFDYDFYDSLIRVAICGYIRPELKFNSLEELIENINKDINVAKEALKNPEKDWQEVIYDPFFHVKS